jgi:signal transduction histidine kinase
MQQRHTSVLVSPDIEKPERPPASHLTDCFNQQLWSDLPIAAFSLSALYAIFACAHPFTVGGAAGWELTSLAATSAIVLFGFGLGLRRSSQFCLANVTVAIFAMIALANTAAHLLLTRDPSQFTNFILLVVAIGAFSLSSPWCVGVIVIVGLVWGAAVYTLTGANPVHYAFAFVSASLVAGLAFRFRTRALAAFFEREWSEQRHLEKLEATEAELIRTNAELEERVSLRTAELQLQVEHARKMEQAIFAAEKLATTGRMAAILAHEINNPLDTVVNCLFLLEHAELRPDERKYLELASAELQRVVRITRHTLGFYRKGDAPKVFDCSSLATDVISALAPMAHGLRVRLEVRTLGAPMLEGFAAEIRQLLTNLVMNAIDAESSRVRVRVGPATDRHSPNAYGVRISVLDNGKGISKEHARDLFEPFFTTKGEKGTGLGLWVCKGIVQKHNGTIAFRSMPKSLAPGSVFSVFIPSRLTETGDTLAASNVSDMVQPLGTS